MLAGLDANVLCYALDNAYPEHEKAKCLLFLSVANKVALNPTVIHETYHTLVFSQKWTPKEAADSLKILLQNPNVEFLNQTRKISTIALNLSVQHKLDGRDALIIANFLANKISVMYTHDKSILRISKITWKNTNISFEDPITQK